MIDTLSRTHRNGARTTEIAVSAVSVGFLAGLLLLFFWVRRRRQRMDRRRLPEQFVDQEGQLSQANLRPKQMVIPDEVRHTDALRVGLDIGVLPTGRAEGDSLCEETVNLRLHRMEAQLEALVTMILPEGSPPSYTS
jgi:hypothetical protein